jgi:hypothetical protein
METIIPLPTELLLPVQCREGCSIHQTATGTNPLQGGMAERGKRHVATVPATALLRHGGMPFALAAGVCERSQGRRHDWKGGEDYGRDLVVCRRSRGARRAGSAGGSRLPPARWEQANVGLSLNTRVNPAASWGQGKTGANSPVSIGNTHNPASVKGMDVDAKRLAESGHL